MKPICNSLSALDERACENYTGRGERVMKKRSPAALLAPRTRYQINVSRTVSPYDIDVEK